MLVYFGLLALSSASVIPRGPTCTDIKIPIEASALNLQVPSALDILSVLKDPLRALISLPPFTSVRVGGKYTINARYCEPARQVSSRRNVLQVLVHGSTYTRNYWSGLAAPGTRAGQEKYSWIDYASNEGFPTLSVDSLCSGLSTRADPILECQVPLEQEALNAVIKAARTSALPSPANRAFEKIVYVGHSFGSMLGNALSAAHPSAVDTLVLTGFTGNITNGAVGAIGIPRYLPATVVDPLRFFGLGAGYLAASDAAGARQIFYDGPYEDAVASYDFANRGTLTVGEILTNPYGQVKVAEYTGSVFVVNGNEDEIFCVPGPVPQLAGQPGNCSAGYSNDVRYMYPAASSFASYDIARTGHCLNLHESSQETFRATHDFLRNAGY